MDSFTYQFGLNFLEKVELLDKNFCTLLHPITLKSPGNYSGADDTFQKLTYRIQIHKCMYKRLQH